MVVRYETPIRRAVRDRHRAVWQRLASDVPFEAEFSEDIVAELYDAEDGAREDLRRLRRCSP